MGGSPAQGAYAVAWPVNRFGFIPKPSESIWHHSVGIEIVAMLPQATSKLQLLMLWGRSPQLLIDGQFILTYFDEFRKYTLRQFPFSVIYQELLSEIIVFAVAHGHRRPGYWRSRT